MAVVTASPRILRSRSAGALPCLQRNLNVLARSGWQIVNGTDVGSRHPQHALEILLDNISCVLSEQYYRADGSLQEGASRHTEIIPEPGKNVRDTSDPLIFVYNPDSHTDVAIVLQSYSPQGEYLELILRDDGKARRQHNLFTYFLYSTKKDARIITEVYQRFSKHDVQFVEKDGVYVPACELIKPL